MIPKFADERLNEVVSSAYSDNWIPHTFDICDQFSGILHVGFGVIELKIKRNKKLIARIEYGYPETYCWSITNGNCIGIYQGILMEHLMSLSDDLAMWLLWNQIL